MTPPDLDRTNALFLDLDGTLLEIAETPESVVVPPGLPQLLESLRSQLDGAVAIVTGRSIGVVDDLLNPFVATAAGEAPNNEQPRFARMSQRSMRAGVP